MCNHPKRLTIKCFININFLIFALERNIYAQSKSFIFSRKLEPIILTVKLTFDKRNKYNIVRTKILITRKKKKKNDERLNHQLN